MIRVAIVVGCIFEEAGCMLIRSSSSATGIPCGLKILHANNVYYYIKIIINIVLNNVALAIGCTAYGESRFRFGMRFRVARIFVAAASYPCEQPALN